MKFMKAGPGGADTIGRVIHDPPPLLRRWRLPVGDGHELQVQEFGRADGAPVLALHGGPGSGGTALLAAVFDPAHWRVIVPDQRGAGASTPAGGLVANTTAHLLADLRRLRQVLGFERWLVYGGSWGATLALAHAADEPQATRALLLRAAFLARPADIEWFFDGARAVRPEAWQALAAALQGRPVQPTLSAWLLGDDPGLQAQATVAWRCWELALAGQPVVVPTGEALAAQRQRLRIQAHYLAHGCWMEPPLLARATWLPPVPTWITHARDDQVCRFEAGATLAAQLPHARFVPLDGGGHDPMHPPARAAVAQALAHLAAHGDFGP